MKDEGDSTGWGPLARYLKENLPMNKTGNGGLLATKKLRDLADAEAAEILADVPEPSRLPYLIEGMIPAGQVHLLGGPSGGGKTTLAFQMLGALVKGEPFLGRQTRQVKIAYISGDRPTLSVLETQDRCGVSFPVFSAVDENLVGEDLITKIFPRLTAVCGGEKPDVIYIDGFTAFVPGGFLNNYSIVAKWLAGLQRYCRKMGITIIGACHTAKTKEGEKFTNPRQRIAGSVAWAGFSETVLIIEPLDDEKAKDKRIVHILPRNHSGENLILKFNSIGQLTLPDKVAQAETITSFVMDGIMSQLKPGTQVLYSYLHDAAIAKGVNARTFNRWLVKSVEDGSLRKEKRGIYVVTQIAAKFGSDLAILGLSDPPEKETIQ